MIATKLKESMNMKKLIKEQLENINEHLQNKIIPFWNQMIDFQCGGFYGSADLQGKPIKNADKGSVYISRILWSYSALYNYYQDPSYLLSASHAFTFLVNNLYDHEHKGVYWSVCHNGEVNQSDKHLYAQSFAIYGFSEYYMASKNSKALEIAEDLANILVKNIAGFPHNYNEQYDLNWNPVSNKYLEEYGVGAKITTNTMLHMAEALSNLYKISRRGKYLVTIKEIIQILFSEGYNLKLKSLNPFIGENYHQTIISYGHNIEVSWLFDEILTIIKENKPEFEQICLDLGIEAIAEGFDGKAINNTKIGEIVDKDKIWWVQAEALIGLINLYQKTKNTRYLIIFTQVFDYIITHLNSLSGEWYWSVDNKGLPTNTHGQAGLWKANYHNIRALLQILKRGDFNGN